MSPKRARRTWPQRLTLTFVIIVALACFGAAGVLASGQWVLSQRKLVTIDAPTGAAGEAGPPQVVVPGGPTTPADQPGAPGASDGSDDGGRVDDIIGDAEPDAANFLITGSDNGACKGDDAATIGDRSALGERSDTIMVWRANPSSDQLAVLSFPRDLFVEIPGVGKRRINSAYTRDDPSRLIETIWNNFGIPIDHYIQIDFCAFKTLVNAVGGVAVPFEYPARDVKSGLEIPEAGCVTLDGDTALAYVRSRSYRYLTPNGWREDGTSDFGRISRQQDFLRRMLARVVAEGYYDPSVARALIETNQKYLVTDSGLTVRRMLEFGGALSRFDPAEITTYRIDSYSQRLGGADYQIPVLDSDNMQAILAVFRGEALLADAPDQAPADETSGDETNDDETTDETTDDGSPSTSLPTVVAEENTEGVAPDPSASCG